jgi:hypothetical protein
MSDSEGPAHALTQSSRRGELPPASRSKDQVRVLQVVVAQSSEQLIVEQARLPVEDLHERRTPAKIRDPKFGSSA